MSLQDLYTHAKYWETARMACGMGKLQHQCHACESIEVEQAVKTEGGFLRLLVPLMTLRVNTLTLDGTLRAKMELKRYFDGFEGSYC